MFKTYVLPVLCLLTANVYCGVTPNRKMTSTDVMCEITLKQDTTRFVTDAIFKIVIIVIYITHSHTPLG